MSKIYMAHSVLIGSIVGYCVDTGRYGLAAGVLSAAVVQLLWSIQDK